MNPMVDPRITDALSVVFLLGMALLAFRELGAIRARMKRDKEAAARKAADLPSENDSPT